MSEQRPTLLLLIPGFPADEKDSTCLPSQQLLVRELNKLFPQLQIIVLAFQYPFVKDEYQWYGNRVIPFNGQNKNKFDRLLLWRRVWKKLRQLQKETLTVGIFSCWCGECALIGKYFARRNSLKHFIWICGQDAKKGNSLVKIIRPDAKSLITISDFLAKEFFKNHKTRPAHIIPIGIDPSSYPHERNALRNIDVLGVGSLIPLKRYEIFVQLVEELKEGFPRLNAVICGEGPDFEKLNALIHLKKLEKNICLLGRTPHDQVLQLMQRSKILLHPSSYEGFGAVCIEALFAGAHVISFCRPMDRQVVHWHIASDKNDMRGIAVEILKDPATDFSPVLVSDMKASATRIMNLFEYPDSYPKASS